MVDDLETLRHEAISGVIKDNMHHLAIRIYYEDTDFSGIVYHANYLKFCERGRCETLRLISNGSASLKEAVFVVRQLRCNFLEPARMDDLIVVETCLIKIGAARLDLQHTIRCNKIVLFKADIVLAAIDSCGKPKRMSLQMRQNFQQVFSNKLL